jgi:hypothetical protein
MMVTDRNFQVSFEKAQKNYNDFIDCCYQPNEGYRLTPKSEVSPYALCFAIFGKHLIGEIDSISIKIELFDKLLRSNLSVYKNNCIRNGLNYKTDKGYLQLLCFTLSALAIIDTLNENSLEDHIFPLVSSKNVTLILQRADIYNGKAGTGNLAMFYAISLIYAKKYLNRDVDDLIKKWINKHLNSMNSNGFWGPYDRNYYLQFQNGYHQYEIYEYLGIQSKSLNQMIDFVSSLSDKQGHFAPYPGGGGCYDYDAIFLLTFLGKISSNKYVPLFKKTIGSILSEQNIDGGFSESLYIRPKSLKNLQNMANHLIEKKGRTRRERARFCLTLLRPKHNNIKTHWTKYSREWHESNLWDSWFRMLTIARIDNEVSLSPIEWGFINFPGIGYCHSLRKDKVSN